MTVWLDVAIGFTCIFVLFSTVCSAILEAYAWFAELRASTLRSELGKLLGDESARLILRDLFEHPLVHNLYRPAWRGRDESSPTYIPTAVFSVAVLDLLIGSAAREALPALRAGLDPSHALDRELLAVLNPGADAAALTALRRSLGDPNGAARAASRARVDAVAGSVLRSAVAEMLADDTALARREALAGRVADFVKRAEVRRAVLNAIERLPATPIGNGLRAVIEAATPDARAQAAARVGAAAGATDDARRALTDASQAVLPGAARDTLQRLAASTEGASVEAAALDLGRLTLNDPLAELHHAIELMGNDSHLGRALRAGVDETVQTAAELRAAVGRWFDQAMENCSATYRRRSQFVLLVIATAVVALCDVDAIRVGRALAVDAPTRAAVVRVAERLQTERAARATTGEIASGSERASIERAARDVIEVRDRVQGFPLGWSSDESPRTPWGWIEKVLGLLLSVVAVSLGAPFWFGLLNQLFSLRSVGRPPPPSAPRA